MLIKSKWCFHRAGQGGFYSGRIKAPNNKHFTFIYDCGSLGGIDVLELEVDRWYAGMQHKGNSQLDLLVLSHLDADHINRVIYLLNKIGACKCVVLPFLTPLERLYLFLGLEDNGADGGGINAAYINFLIDPTETLNNAAQIEQIIYVRGDGESGSSANTNKPIEPDPIRDNDTPFTVTPLESDYTENRFPTGVTPVTVAELRGDASNVIFKKDKWSFYAGIFWEFYFYNKPYSQERVNQYRDIVNDVFGNDIDVNGFNTDSLRKILAHENLSTAKKAFKAAFDDMNSPGLVVLHGPVNPRAIRVAVRRKWKYFDHFILRGRGSIYTLLNGDINLNDINYPQYIIERLSHTYVFQVPHHGSKHSWSSHVISNELFRTFMVIHFGWGNKHGHPGSIVMEDIKNRFYWRKKLVNQYKRFVYKVKAEF